MSFADLKTISKFAQLEYSMGSPERGRTIFEGIIDTHRKRLDIWNIYLDMEAGQKNIQGIRFVPNNASRQILNFDLGVFVNELSL